MLALVPFTSQAQGKAVQDALYIFRNDGGFNAFFYNEIDRFEYSKVDTFGVEQKDYCVQEIYALDSIFRIPLSAIDSIAFVTPENVYKSDVKVNGTSKMWDYVIGSDTIRTLQLAKNIPADLIPKVGDKLVQDKAQKYLPGVFWGKVSSVTTGSNAIIVTTTPIAFDEAFDRYVCKVEGQGGDEKLGARVRNARMRASGEPEKIDFDRDPVRYKKDLQQLAYDLGNDISASVEGGVDIGYQDFISLRVFYYKDLLNENFDMTMRTETKSWFDFKAKGGLSLSIDKDFAEFDIMIPYTPFALKTEIGINAGIGGTLELNVHRLNVKSSYLSVQLNKSLVTLPTGMISSTTHMLSSEESTSLTGEASITFGPYAKLCVGFPGTDVLEAGLRLDVGMKATVSAEVKWDDLLVALPGGLDFAYDNMISSPTGVYDKLNRDGSITMGPFITTKSYGKFYKWGTEKLLLEGNLSASFQGGLVPFFRTVNMTYDNKELTPTAKATLSREVLLATPVGFAMYNKKTGKLVGEEKWYDRNFWHSNFTNYSIKMGKHRIGGRTMILYPSVRLLGYEMLASPYKEVRVDPMFELKTPNLEFDEKGEDQRTEIDTNIDLEDEDLEIEFEYDYGETEKGKPEEEVNKWFEVEEVERDKYEFVVKIADGGSSNRNGFVDITVKSSDKVINVKQRLFIAQKVNDELPEAFPSQEIIAEMGMPINYGNTLNKLTGKYSMGSKPQQLPSIFFPSGEDDDHDTDGFMIDFDNPKLSQSGFTQSDEKGNKVALAYVGTGNKFSMGSMIHFSEQAPEEGSGLMDILGGLGQAFFSNTTWYEMLTGEITPEGIKDCTYGMVIAGPEGYTPAKVHFDLVPKVGGSAARNRDVLTMEDIKEMMKPENVIARLKNNPKFIEMVKKAKKK